ncbi:hypothetical protein AB1Y20_017206 [Prymnesium parvum]|uniref:Uncharacterized protein n=1 Tax=Prymnesium parvum TaxID=97485 RepID=A0AB34IB91_PRYPA
MFQMVLASAAVAATVPAVPMSRTVGGALPLRRITPRHPPCFCGRGVQDAALAVANPVVWLSLCSLSATGGGLPAGPYGLLGALEGVSYVLVVGSVGAALLRNRSDGNAAPPLGLAEKLSFLSVLAAVVVLAGLLREQGCVPNALPLVDYSAYVRVCH